MQKRFTPSQNSHRFVKPRVPSVSRGLCLAACGALSLVLASQAKAFPYRSDLFDLPNSFGITGQRTQHVDFGTRVDFNIPIEDWPDSIEFSKVRGGDGGRARALADVGDDKSIQGGGGAELGFNVSIHPTAKGSLKPGGEIRLVIGSVGFPSVKTENAAGGGGGGTAVLYRAPIDGADWEFLAVAGGGGGAVASTSFANEFKQEGRNANTGVNGSAGKLRSNSSDGTAGGVNGGAGECTGKRAGGGGSVLEFSRGGAGEFQAVGGQPGWWTERFPDDPEAHTAIGGDGGEGYNGGADGGFGFGAGGGAGAGTWARGGGGGGWSGGGAGGRTFPNDNDGAGGGGGSFLNSIVTDPQRAEREGEGLNGYISFSLVGGDASRAIGLPTLSITGGNSATIYDFELADYELPSASVTDYYGNSFNVVTPSLPGDLGVGTHTFTYEGRDQFGNPVSQNFTLNIQYANKPTFDIAGNITVTEDSGAYQAPFISNANANDPGQEINFYALGNYENSGLFTTIPHIDDEGRLNFTLADDANGFRSIGIIAYDNYNADPINGISNLQTFTITVTSVDDPPTLTQLTPAVISENSTGAVSFAAEDPFGGLISYSLSGDDAAFFTFDPSTLTLSFASSQDYESPADSDGDNLYEVTLAATGSDGATSSALQVQVTDVNEAPFAPTLSNNSVRENTTSVGTVAANDPEGDAVTYGLAGADAALFHLDTITGELNFLVAPDYENPSDSDTNNQYELTLSATDSNQLSISSPFTVSVRNASVPLSTPTLSANKLLEGNSIIGELFSEGESGELLYFRILGGSDETAFEIVDNTLRFKTPPDFENPTDQNGDNVYEVQLVSRVYDFESPLATFSITVVSGSNQTPSAPALTNAMIFENSKVVGELSSSDAEGDPFEISITGGADAYLFEIANDGSLAFIEAPDFDQPADADANNLYEVLVSATDQFSRSSESAFTIVVQDIIDNPAIDILLDGESVDEISLEENLPAGTVVATISAVDTDLNDSNTFRLISTSSRRFEIINGNELAVTGNPQLDYEADDFHNIRIQATDSIGLIYTKQINIPVIDVDETSILRRSDYTLDTNTNSIWLHPVHTNGKKVSVVEGRINRGEVFGEGYDWQFATWDEYIEYLKNSSRTWRFDILNGYWAFWFDDDYFDHDGTDSATLFLPFGMLALNRDGGYGRNRAAWNYDSDGKPRVLSIYPQSQSSLVFRQELYDEGVRNVTPFSPEADQSRLHLEGEPNTQNRSDIFLIVDRSSGVGFENWAQGQERSTVFTADDNGSGRSVALDYVFGDQRPMQVLSTNQVVAPKNTWKDIEISLQCSSDFETWTTLLTYRGGTVVQTETELQAHGLTIENGVITHGNGGLEDRTFYRYSVQPFDENMAQ